MSKKSLLAHLGRVVTLLLGWCRFNTPTVSTRDIDTIAMVMMKYFPNQRKKALTKHHVSFVNRND